MLDPPALFHVSDRPDIEAFAPRHSAHTDVPVVWAIARTHIANYLLPRECPRVTFYAGAETMAADRDRFLGDDRHVVAIEADWLERVRTETLHVYRMPAEGFVLTDAGAGYWTNRGRVTPSGVETVADLPDALVRAGATLRVLPSLWDLHDVVSGSSLVFSMIRMRNAIARA